jgi:hypothetical protein
VNTRPAYAPALVGFVDLNDGNQVGWVPLGPGDIYTPRYYDANWQPRYLTRANIMPGQFINFGIPGAVTVVPVDAWGRAIDPREAGLHPGLVVFPVEHAQPALVVDRDQGDADRGFQAREGEDDS